MRQVRAHPGMEFLGACVSPRAAFRASFRAAGTCGRTTASKVCLEESSPTGHRETGIGPQPVDVLLRHFPSETGNPIEARKARHSREDDVDECSREGRQAGCSNESRDSSGLPDQAVSSQERTCGIRAVKTSAVSCAKDLVGHRVPGTYAKRAQPNPQVLDRNALRAKGSGDAVSSQTPSNCRHLRRKTRPSL